MKKFKLTVCILQLPFWLIFTNQTAMGETVKEWLEKGYYSHSPLLLQHAGGQQKNCCPPYLAGMETGWMHFSEPIKIKMKK